MRNKEYVHGKEMYIRFKGCMYTWSKEVDSAHAEWLAECTNECMSVGAGLIFSHTKLLAACHGASEGPEAPEVLEILNEARVFKCLVRARRLSATDGAALLLDR